MDSIDWDSLKKIFLLACLLHDVGHAPFSHTGEDFYLNETIDNNVAIYVKLLDTVSSIEFKKDVSEFYHKGKAAAPHEIMSAIIALEEFKENFEDPSEKELFARCITGYQYRDGFDDVKNIKNCLICLLNSSIIDIDKLDYIIRDSYMTGFQSVSIDYFRLLNSVTLVELNSKKLLAYNKRALSVIENVVYAHDSERKWIQSHPVVLYEHFLIQHAIRKVDRYFSKDHRENKLFSYKSLSITGSNFKEKGRIRLLSDEDIIYNIKNVCGDELTDEYFIRGLRRHPIWKSEAEYRSLFDTKVGNDILGSLEIVFYEIEKFLIDNLDIPVINDEVIVFCNNEYKKLDEYGTTLSAKDIQSRINGLNNIMKWLRLLKEFTDESGIPFDFVIINAKRFQSGFLKDDLEKVIIDFPDYNRPRYIKDVANILNSTKTRERFFFLYYRRTDKKIDALALAKTICQALLNDDV
jgi:HD superfamily phosphohydrolase